MTQYLHIRADIIILTHLVECRCRIHHHQIYLYLFIITHSCPASHIFYVLSSPPPPPSPSCKSVFVHEW